MKKTFLFLIVLLISLTSIEIHAQAIHKFVDPVMLRTEIERNVKENKRLSNMPPRDSLRHSLQKMQRESLWSAIEQRDQDLKTLLLDNSDTISEVGNSKKLVRQMSASVDEQIFKDSIVTYRNGNVPERKIVYSYDANGNQVSEIEYQGDGYNWKPYSKKEKVYNENGNQLLRASWYWDDEISWKGSYKYEYDYDENGKCILEAYYNGWDSEINDWKGSSLYQYQYDASGNRSMSISLRGWNSETHTFDNGSKTEYKYNKRGYRIEGLESAWDPKNNQFVLKYKYEYDYDENGKCILEAQYDFNVETDSWAGLYKHEYAYTYVRRYYGYRRTLDAYYDGWDSEKGEWIGYEKEEHDYDSYGNKTLDSNSNWDNTTGDWYVLWRKEYEFKKNSDIQTSYSYYKWDVELNKLKGIDHWTTVYNSRGDITQHNTYSWNNETDDWSCDVKYDYEFNYDSNHNIISSTASVNDVYLYKNEYEYDDRGREVGSVSYSWDGENWVNYDKMSREYDDYNRKILEQTYAAAEDGTWIDQTKEEWGYRGTSYYANAILDAKYVWNIEDQTWHGVTKYEYTYDSNGRELSYFQYNGWNTTLGWIYEMGHEYEYNQNGRRTKYIEYNYWDKSNNCWSEATKQETTYNSNDCETLIVSSVWDADAQIWLDRGKTVREYNEFNYTTSKEIWSYDDFAEKWIGQSKDEYAYDDNERLILYASYYGWDSEGDCWRGDYKNEYAYNENGFRTLYATYSGWDYVNHTWRGSSKSEYQKDEYEDSYVNHEVKSEWDETIPGWKRIQKLETGYIIIRDTTDYGVNTRNYQSYQSRYSTSDGESWNAESKTEYSYDETMRRVAEVFYIGADSDVEWVYEAKREYEFDIYGNICKDNYSLYDSNTDTWAPENTTLYYYTKGVNVLDEDEWLNLKSVYAELSKRVGWKKQWYDCNSINSAYSWSGVTRSEGHVTGIDISGFNLSGSFPYHLFSLPYLKEINISNNNFEGDLTTEFADSIKAINGNADKVTSLYMANNNFGGNASAIIPYFPSLTSLNLSGNKFDEVAPMLPTSITSLNLGKQRSDKVIDLHISNVNFEDIIKELPSIWFYNHEEQSFSPWIDMIITESDANSFSWNGKSFSILLSQEDGKLILSQVSQNKTEYHGESGDSLNVICDSGIAQGSTLKVRLSFDEGDANFINGVDASDLQATILYVFGTYGTYPFNYTAADTHKDDVINVQDVVCTVNILLAQTPDNSNSPMRIPAYGSSDIPAEASIYIENGQIILNSTRPVAALDLAVEGQVIWDVERFGLLQSVAGGHLVAYSLTGATLPVGPTVIGEVVGDSQILGVSLSDAQAQAISVSTDKDEATGISDVNSESGANSVIYDLNGRRIEKAVNGINIIKNANGVKKILK